MKEKERVLCLDINFVAFYIMLSLQDIKRFANEVFPVGSECQLA